MGGWPSIAKSKREEFGQFLNRDAHVQIYMSDVTMLA